MIAKQPGIFDRAHELTTAIIEDCDGPALHQCPVEPAVIYAPDCEPSGSAVASPSPARYTRTLAISMASSTAARTTRPTTPTGTPDRPVARSRRVQQHTDDNRIVILILILRARDPGASACIQISVPPSPMDPNLQLRPS